MNTENVDFSLTQVEPVQEFVIPSNQNGEISNAVKLTKFSAVHKLIIHLKNEDLERIEVSYIQIRG